MWPQHGKKQSWELELCFQSWYLLILMCFQSWAVVSVTPGVFSLRKGTQYSVVFIHLDTPINIWDLCFLTHLDYNPISLYLKFSQTSQFSSSSLVLAASCPRLPTLQLMWQKLTLVPLVCPGRGQWDEEGGAESVSHSGSLSCSPGSCWVPEGRGNFLNSTLGLSLQPPLSAARPEG